MITPVRQPLLLTAICLKPVQIKVEYDQLLGMRHRAQSRWSLIQASGLPSRQFVMKQTTPVNVRTPDGTPWT